MDYSRYQEIDVKREGKVLVATLNRPNKLNAVSPLMHAELPQLFADIRHDDETHVAVITGAGRGFCAGADLTGGVPAKEEAEKMWGQARDLIVNILECDKPLVSAVNGAAAGLGATIALFQDIVIMSDQAKIGDTHTRVAVTAGDGGCVIWPLLVGPNKAKELLMLGEVIPAAEALRIGLVNHVVPHEQLMPFTMEIANKLATGQTNAIRTTKKAVNQYVKWMVNQVFDYGLAMEYSILMSVFYRNK